MMLLPAVARLVFRPPTLGGPFVNASSIRGGWKIAIAYPDFKKAFGYLTQQSEFLWGKTRLHKSQFCYFIAQSDGM